MRDALGRPADVVAVSAESDSGTPKAMADETTRKRRTPGRHERSDAGAGQLEASVARGRGAGTPFALLGSVAFLVWGVLGVLAVLLLLIWWLA